jgi:tRNA(fMet)-specific endonuclease VapC
MARLTFILDTNVISDLVKGNPDVHAHLNAHSDDEVCLCQPVYFESLRGLLWKKASAKTRTLEKLRAELNWLPLENDDWQQAAQLWANAVGQGKQLADMDLLVAAIALRIDAVVVTADDDFDALPVKRVNWREPPSTP